MIKLNRVYAVLLTAVSIALLAPAVSVAQGSPDRDAREVSSYVLTETALAKYKKASGNLGELAKTVSGNCDDDEGSGSLDESVARLNAVPGAQAAIQSAGMTSREYIVFTMSLFQNGMASWALTQPGGTLPPGVSKANIDFYRAHEQALQSLGNSGGSDPCDDRDSEEGEIDEESTE
jgi:hypothetical protein